LTDDKKLDILERWNSIIADIKRHRDEMEQEKEILLIQALKNIEHDLEEY